MSGQETKKLDAYMREEGDVGAGPASRLDWRPELPEEEFARIASVWASYAPLDPASFEVQTPSHPQRLFGSFLYDIRPEYLKRHRLQSNLLLVGTGLDDPLPASSPIWTIVWGHWYASVGDGRLSLIDIVAARRAGATKAEVSHYLSLGQFHGHNWLNATARFAEDYMRDWDADDGSPGLQWPEGWRSDPDVFQSGIDFLDFDESKLQDEVELIREWHRRWQGEVPAYVDFYAKHWPMVLRAFRARYETAAEGPLPCQMVVLLELDIALKRTRPDAIRRALRMAKAVGLSKDQVVQEISFTQLLLGDDSMDSAVRGLDEVLAEWEA